MFYKYYVLTGKVSKEYSKFYNELFDMRHEDDYDDFATISPELTAQMLARAGEFLQTLETLINTELEQH